MIVVPCACAQIKDWYGSKVDAKPRQFEGVDAYGVPLGERGFNRDVHPDAEPREWLDGAKVAQGRHFSMVVALEPGELMRICPSRGNFNTLDEAMKSEVVVRAKNAGDIFIYRYVYCFQPQHCNL